MSLRDITKDLHAIAEGTKASHLLVSGDVTKEQYRSYLYQLIAIYGPIEFSGKVQGFFQPIKDDPRLPKIYQDYAELADPEVADTWLPETVEYMTYLFALINDPARRHLIKAHGYIRLMGDMAGGQLLAKTVPGGCRMFQFKTPPSELKFQMLPEFTDDLGDEARVAFTYFIKIMKAFGGEA